MSDKTYVWLAHTFGLEDSEFKKVVKCIQKKTGASSLAVVRTLAENVQPYNLPYDVIFYETSKGDELFATKSSVKGYKILFIVNPREIRVLVPFPKWATDTEFYNKNATLTQGFPRLCSMDVKIDSDRATITSYEIYTDTSEAPKDLKRNTTLISKEMLCSAMTVLEEIRTFKLKVTMMDNLGNRFDSTVGDILKGCATLAR